MKKQLKDIEDSIYKKLIEAKHRKIFLEKKELIEFISFLINKG